MENIEIYNEAFKKKQPFTMPPDFLQECYTEIIKLILENHWSKFVRMMKKMKRMIIFNDEICLTPLSASEYHSYKL